MEEKEYKRRFDTIEGASWMMWDIDDLLYGYLKMRATYNPQAGELYFTSKFWNKTSTKQEIKKVCGIERKRERDTHFNRLLDSGLLILKDEGTKNERYVFQNEGAVFKLVPLDLLGYLLNTASRGVIQIYIWLLDKYEYKDGYEFTRKEIAYALGYSDSMAETGDNKRINDILACLVRQGIIKYETVPYITTNNKKTFVQKLTFVAKSIDELKPVEPIE